MKKVRLIVLPLVVTLVFLLAPGRPQYYLSVVALFQNESPYLKEWIEYHKLLGVDHFYMLNNNSDDGYLQVLTPYIESGEVELMSLPEKGTLQKEFNKIQCGAYTHILKTKQKETFWLAVIDTDEFILPLDGSSLPSFLKEYESYGGIAINWQLYGTADVEKIPLDATMIGTLTKKARSDHPNNRFVKTICQPKRVKKMTQPHFCRYKKPFYHVGEKKNRLPSLSITKEVSVDKICINHYTFRDKHFFETVKKQRMLNWYPEKEAIANPDFNEVEDLCMDRHVTNLEERLFQK